MKKKEYKDLMDNLTLVTQVGLTVVGSVLLCLAIGYYLDKWLGTRGVFTIIFIVLGVVGGAYTAYRQIKEVTDGNSEGGGAHGL